MYNSEFGRRLRTQSSGASGVAGASSSSTPSSSSGALLGGASPSRGAHSRAGSHTGAAHTGASSAPNGSPAHASGSGSRARASGVGANAGAARSRDSLLDAGAAGRRGSSSSALLDETSGKALGKRGSTASLGEASKMRNGERPRTPGKGKATAYADRYIPTRDGTDMQTAYQLMADEPSASNRQKRKVAVDMDAQQEEANQAFSSLLTTELFGEEGGPAARGINGHAPSGHSSVHSSGGGGGSRHSSNLAAQSPSTPTKKNLFSYHSPSSSSSRSKSVGTPGRSGGADRTGLYSGVVGVGPGSAIGDATPHAGGLFGGIASSLQPDSLDSPLHSAYNLSPVKIESQRMLLSPRRAPRTLSKVPYKVLDAPELADDFYLNLVDWSSQNVLGVGLGQCVYLWSARTSSVQKLVDLSEGNGQDRITGLNWSSNGKYLAVGTNAGQVQVWDAEYLKKVRTMTGHTARVGALAWNSPILTTGSRDRSIFHRDTREPEHSMAELRGHRQEVCGLKWNTVTNQLASGGNDNKLIVWNGLQTAPLLKFTDHQAAVKAIAWSPHQQGLLASGGGTADMRIRFWNTITGKALSEVDTGSQVCNLVWSKTANEVISSHGYSGGKVQNQIQIWRYPGMQQLATLTGHTMRVLYLGMSPDGETIVSGAGDETLRFWDLNTPSKSQIESRTASSSLDPFTKLR